MEESSKALELLADKLIKGELYMKEKFIQFLRDEDGQTSTEYILLVAVVALIVFRFKGIATTKLTALTESIFGQATDQINNEFSSLP